MKFRRILVRSTMLVLVCVLFLPFSANANDEATVIPEIYINEIIDTTSISPIEYDRARNSLQNTEDAIVFRQSVHSLFLRFMQAAETGITP